MTTHRRRSLLTALAIGSLVLTGCSSPEPEEPEAPTSPPATTEESLDPDAGQEPEPAQETEPEQEPAITQDPELVALLEPLIAEDIPAISLIASDDILRDCGIQATGCYIPAESAIYAAADATEYRLPEILAHEFLHVVWYRDDLDGDRELIDALNTAYDDAEGLGALVPPWQEQYVNDDGSILPTELFSYVCTGLRPNQMDAVILESCERYVNLDALPVSQSITPDALLDAVSDLRETAGLEPLQLNPQAVAASEARAELFTPHSQVPLGEYPDSVREHLDAGCAPSRYAARLTRPYEPAEMVADIDSLLDGALSGSTHTGIGIAVTEFDFIDARELFGERTIMANATLIITTICE